MLVHISDALAKLYGIPVEELLHETQEEKSED